MQIAPFSNGRVCWCTPWDTWQAKAERRVRKTAVKHKPMKAMKARSGKFLQVKLVSTRVFICLALQGLGRKTRQEDSWPGAFVSWFPCVPNCLFLFVSVLRRFCFGWFVCFVCGLPLALWHL